MNHQAYSWTSFGIITGLGCIALFLALPRPLKPGYFILSVSVLGIIVGTGLFLSRSVGLKILVFSSEPFGDNLQQLLQILGQATLIGVGLGTVILVVIRFLLLSIVPEIRLRFAAESSLETWKRVVIAFDSAVLEEIIFRLFLLSLLVWIVSKIWQIQKPPTPGIFWIINLLIAIGFGIAHLPQWSAITPLTPLVILTIVLLNSIGGLTFGHLFYTNGLEGAIVAHFVADIMLHVVGLSFLQT
jgi:hypothetical protein